ncbi:hypothetical protein AWC38_SpisGene20434 [Stylophora pistillata]|uniref:Uncharacterized protein n=1 Tax=Stylophora pistillata TaxID=50429 RepID=A0A2B4RDX5_STYPI|nr:hypothetical protein AWC38_SpisGene20434 [Stylophora pistillata]
MANAEVNERIEKDGKSVSSGEEDENALLAEDGNDHDTNGAHAIAPFNYEKLFKDCKRKLGPSKKKTRKALSDSDDVSDDSGSDEVNAILGEEEEDGDSSDKFLKEVEQEYNAADKRAQI